MENIKITIEISGSPYTKDASSQDKECIAFAKFAKSYQSPRKVEQAWEWWLKRNRKPL